MQHPVDTFVSNYHFVPNLVNISVNDLTMEDFYFGYYASNERPNYYDNIVSWYKHRYVVHSSS